MKERWDLNRRAVRLLCHLDRKYFLCTLFSSLTTAIAPYIPIYFSAKIIDALTAGAGGKTLALYAALTVGLTALHRRESGELVRQRPALGLPERHHHRCQRGCLCA